MPVRSRIAADGADGPPRSRRRHGARPAARSGSRPRTGAPTSKRCCSRNATTVAPLRRVAGRPSKQRPGRPRAHPQLAWPPLPSCGRAHGGVALRRKPGAALHQVSRESPAPPGSEARVRAGWMTFKSQRICSFDIGSSSCCSRGYEDSQRRRCVSSRCPFHKALKRPRIRADSRGLLRFRAPIVAAAWRFRRLHRALAIVTGLPSIASRERLAGAFLDAVVEEPCAPPRFVRAVEPSSRDGLGAASVRPRRRLRGRPARQGRTGRPRGGWRPRWREPPRAPSPVRGAARSPCSGSVRRRVMGESSPRRRKAPRCPPIACLACVNGSRVQRGDPCLDVVLGQHFATRALLEEPRALGEEPLVPERAVLLEEVLEVAVAEREEARRSERAGSAA